MKAPTIRLAATVFVAVLTSTAWSYTDHFETNLTSDETWFVGTHWVHGTQTLNSHTISINAQAGWVWVKVDPGVPCVFLLNGSGRLRTRNTGANGVTVTSAGDNTGGETLSVRTPNPGDYGHLVQVTGGGSVTLDNLTGRYGGSGGGYVSLTPSVTQSVTSLRFTDSRITNILCGTSHTTGSVIYAGKNSGPVFFSNCLFDSAYGGNDLYGRYITVYEGNGKDTFQNLAFGPSVTSAFSSAIYVMGAKDNTYMNNLCFKQRSWSAVDFYSMSAEPNTLYVSNITTNFFNETGEPPDYQDAVDVGNLGGGVLDVVVRNSVFSLWPSPWSTGVNLNGSYGGGEIRGDIAGVFGHGMLGDCPGWCGGIATTQGYASLRAADTFQVPTGPVGNLPAGCVIKAASRIPDGSAIIDTALYQRGCGTYASESLDNADRSSTGARCQASDTVTAGYQYPLRKFRYSVLDSVSPNSGYEGDTALLHGNYFQAGLSGKVKFGKSVAVVVSQGDDTIVVIVPSMSHPVKKKTKNVTYTNPDNRSVTLLQAFTYK